MLTGQNGILTQANNSKTEQSHGAVKEAISLAYNEWQIEVNTGSRTKLASIEIVTIKGEEEKAKAGTEETFLQFLERKGYIKEDTTDVLNIEKLTGSKQALGNGEDTDIYKIEEQDGNYILSYYGTDNKEEQLWSVAVSTGSSEGNISYNDELKTLKPGDYVIYDTGVAETGEVVCRVLYDANSEYGLQIITNDCIKENGEYVEVVLEGKEGYNNAIGILNAKAGKYKNDTYSIDARCVGSNPKNKDAESTEFARYDGYTTDVKMEDNNYETDYNVLNSLNMLECEEGYFMASRYINYGNTYVSVSYEVGVACYIRNTYNSFNPTTIIYFTDGDKEEERSPYYNNCLRPVFTLRGDLELVSGDGQSEETAYKFN